MPVVPLTAVLPNHHVFLLDPVLNNLFNQTRTFFFFLILLAMSATRCNKVITHWPKP